jgi:DNA-binding NtrC family response regulator
MMLGSAMQAEGGTLLLKHVETLSEQAQVHLLRLVEQGTYQSQGSPEVRRADLRLITTANTALEPAVASGRFRLDLYYRINEREISMPSLRERPEDLVPLSARYFAEKAPERSYFLSEDAADILKEYEWPGNVRELGNVLDGAMHRQPRGEILARHLPPLFQKAESEALAMLTRRLDAALDAWLQERVHLAPGTYDDIHADLERLLLRHLMRAHEAKPTALAKSLAINRNTLRKKLASAGISRRTWRSRLQDLQGE